jgi:hypothetical protein
MSSHADNAVSPGIGELLELLNAFEQENDHSRAEFEAPEGQGAQDSWDDDYVADPSQASQPAEEEHLAFETEAELPHDEPIAQPSDLTETDAPDREVVENRFAAHIVKGMWKTKVDWPSES